MLSFFPLDVLDDIWDVTESVSAESPMLEHDISAMNGQWFLSCFTLHQFTFQ